jgi:hypothetical protein
MTLNKIITFIKPTKKKPSLREKLKEKYQISPGPVGLTSYRGAIYDSYLDCRIGAFSNNKVSRIDEDNYPAIAEYAAIIISNIEAELAQELVPETIFDKGREPFLDDGTLAARDKHYRQRLKNMIIAIETIQAYQAELDAHHLTHA